MESLESKKFNRLEENQLTSIAGGGDGTTYRMSESHNGSGNTGVWVLDSITPDCTCTGASESSSEATG